MLKRLGIVLIVLSFVLYGIIFLVPFLGFSGSWKAGIITGLVISGEVTFWVGGLLVGREVVKKYRQQMNPMNWFKKNKQPEPAERGEGNG